MTTADLRAASAAVHSRAPLASRLPPLASGWGPQQQLALAVVERAMLDLRSRDRLLREQARMDITSGRLGPWLAVAADDAEVAERVGARLCAVATQRPRSARSPA